MFRDEFISFLEESGITFIEEGEGFFSFPGKDTKICIVPLGKDAIQRDCIHLFEDRWRSGGSTIRSRILAHLGIHRTIFARKCDVQKIDAATAAAFLNLYHSYGNAQSRYRYGLFLGGEMVAAATFSGKRMMPRGERTLASYEWIRYASLPDVRICGGMGRVMAAFVRDIHPQEIMSYADLEWSDGQVYTTLGFREAGKREPVTFTVDTLTWKRTPVKENGGADGVSIRNFGSIKYLKEI